MTARIAAMSSFATRVTREVTHLDGTSDGAVERRRAAVMRRTYTLVARLGQGGVKWWTAC